MIDRGDSGDLTVGVPLAAYCAGWFLWVIVRFIEMVFSVSNLTRDLFVNVSAGVVVALAAFALALWQGDRIADHFAERRRLREWRIVSRFCSTRITHALVQNIGATLIARPKKNCKGFDLSPDLGAADPMAEQYQSWASTVREILHRGDAGPQAITAADFELMAVILQLRLRIYPALRERLDRVVSAHNDALPTDLRKALIRVTDEIEFYCEQCLVPEPDTNTFWQQVHINFIRSLALFEALADLARLHGVWNREVHTEFEGRVAKGFGREMLGRHTIDLAGLFDGPLPDETRKSEE